MAFSTALTVGSVASVVVLLSLLAPASGVTVHDPVDPVSVSQAALPFTPLKLANAAGYFVKGGLHSVLDVKGSWVVPAIASSCHTGHSNSFMEQVIGIDGINTTDYGFVGTYGACVKYGAFYEFYPATSGTAVNMTIRPGDYVLAEISYQRGQFHASLKDLNTSKSFSKAFPGLYSPRVEALWAVSIVGTSATELAPFGTAKFGWDYTGVRSTNTANVSGTVTTIGGSGAHYRFWMYDSTGTVIRAEALALTSSGLSFTVVWKHY